MLTIETNLFQLKINLFMHHKPIILIINCCIRIKICLSNNIYICLSLSWLLFVPTSFLNLTRMDTLIPLRGWDIKDNLLFNQRLTMMSSFSSQQRRKLQQETSSDVYLFHFICLQSQSLNLSLLIRRLNLERLIWLSQNQG